MNKLSQQEVLELVRAGFTKEEILAMQSEPNESSNKKESKNIVSSTVLPKEDMKELSKATKKLAGECALIFGTIATTATKTAVDEIKKYKKEIKQDEDLQNAKLLFKKAWADFKNR